MIEKLYEHTVTDPCGDIIGTREPNIREIKDKINEIIDVVNQLTEDKNKDIETDK